MLAACLFLFVHSLLCVANHIPTAMAEVVQAMHQFVKSPGVVAAACRAVRFIAQRCDPSGNLFVVNTYANVSLRFCVVAVWLSV